jgi:hypothetical protein
LLENFEIRVEFITFVIGSTFSFCHMAIMKHACKHCPYKRDVKPFLHPERGEQLAYHTTNPYNEFPCHKTTEHDEDSDDGERIITERSLECAGFVTMQLNNTNRKTPKGFEPIFELVYDEPSEMAEAYATPEDHEERMKEFNRFIKPNIPNYEKLC